MRFFYPSLFFLITLFVYFDRLNLFGYECKALGGCGLLFILVLAFLASLYSSMILTEFGLTKIVKYFGLFFIIGVLITISLWPVTYFGRGSSLCSEFDSCEDNSVTYLSFTKNSALKRLNNYSSEDFPLNGSIISRGMIWPGSRSYYDYTASRESKSEEFHIVNGYFDYNAFIEFSFVFSYFIAVLSIIYRFVQGIYFRVRS